MNQILRQSTVVVIPFGPVSIEGTGTRWEGSGLSSVTTAGVADSAAIITAFDNAATGIMLSKNGGALTIREQGANFVATTYDSHGCFKVSLSAIDTGTLGRIRVIHSSASYLPVSQDFMVAPQQVWDSLFGSDKLDVAVVEQANIDFGALQKSSLNASTPAASNMRGTDNAALAATALSNAIWTSTRAAKLDDLWGPDAITHPFIVTQTGGATVAGAIVWASTDSAGANVVEDGVTDENGLYNFHVPAGSYWFWARHSGLNPASVYETVS
jgi:hypothetical protein